MPRKPIVSGQFYPDDKAELNNEIKSFFKEINIDSKLLKQKIYGGIVPHAGYVFSGKTAAYLYKLIETKKIDLFIIFGTNHSARENIIVNLEDFETPLGIVKTSKLAKNISEELKKNKFNVGTQEQEHSIEVQLPFLEHICKNKTFEILPILTRINNSDDARKIAEIVFNTINKNNYHKNKNIFVIASSDFTHYGYSYGFVPFRENVLENLKKLDFLAISEIETMNIKAFLEKARKTTICGQDAIACSIEFCKLLGAKKAQLLKYATSAEITKDIGNVVAYASIAFL